MTDEQLESGFQSNRTRRGLLRGLGVTAGGTVLAAALAERFVGAAAAVDAEASEFAAADTPTVENNDGQVSAVYVAPAIDVFWENFAEGVQEVAVTLDATVGEKTDRIYDVVLEEVDDDTSEEVANASGGTTDVFSNTSGSFTIEFAQHDITAVGTDITEDDFSDSTLDAGASKTTEVNLELVVDVVGNQNEDGTVTISDAFVVEVQNPDGDTEIQGDANTDAE